MTRTKRTAWAMLVTAGVAASDACGQDAGFWLTGLAPRTTQSAVTCLTADGITAGGYSISSAPFFQAGFTWTKSSGRNDFGLSPGMPKVNGVSGISDDGIAAGAMYDGATIETLRAFRWTGTGPLQDLGVLPNQTRSVASGINGEGNVVVGYAESGPQTNVFGEAFRWTPSGGMQGLGHLKPSHTFSRANAVSRDGMTIVGDSWSFDSGGGFIWTEASGIMGLAGLPSAPAADTQARSVNADGSVVVGLAVTDVGAIHAVRWVNGRPEDLDDGFSTVSLALAVSDDGGVVGGSYGSVPGGLAFLWSEETGMLDAHDYLAVYGVAMPPDYQIEDVLAVSGDGLTFAGQARNRTTGIREGFVATVPTPGAASMLAAMPMLVRRRVL